MSAEQDTAMYDQPDDAGDQRTAADKAFDAEANREAEFWRTHTRDDAWPDDEAAPTVRDYFPNITEEHLSSPGFRAMATAWQEGRDAEATSVTTVEPNPSPDYPGTMTVTRWTPPVNPYLPRENV